LFGATGSVSKRSDPNAPSRPDRVSFWARIEVALEPPPTGSQTLKRDSTRSDWTHLDGATVVERRPYAAVGSSRQAAEAALADRPYRALLNARERTEVRLGDVSSLYGMESRVTDADVPAFAASVARQAVGGSSTVINYGTGRLLNAPRISQQIDALVAVAGAYNDTDREWDQG